MIINTIHKRAVKGIYRLFYFYGMKKAA